MNRTIYEKLKAAKPVLRSRFGIEKIALVGSQARGDHTPASDVDIVILEGERDYYKRLGAIKYLSKYLGKRVDLVHIEAIRPVIREYIAKDLVRV